MASSSKKSAGKANLLGKREPKDDLETEPILKKHKENSEEKETTKGFADSLQQIKGRVELLETNSDQANLIPLKETVEVLDETPDFVEAVAVKKNTLFVSHLRQPRIREIIHFFKDVGKVFSVRLGVNLEAKHVGYGFVEFASAHEAKKAQEKMITLGVSKIAPYPARPKYCIEHKVWYEDYIRRESLPIEEDEAVEGLDETPDFIEIQEVAVRKKTLFIANLPSPNIREIINFFQDVGEVFSVRLIVDYWGKHVGCGFVEFASAYVAKKALEKKDGERFHGNYIFLDVADIAPYSLRPKCNLAEKLWYEDYLRRESLLIEEDDLETKTILKKHKEKSEEKETTKGFADRLQQIKGRVELLETKSDQANLIPVKETVEGLDETPDFVEAVAVRKKTLFVSHLRQLNMSHIIHFFKDVGKVISVRLGVNHEGKRVGYGFVEFASAYEAKKAQEKIITLGMAKIAPYPARPKYCIEHKFWYEGYLRRESFPIGEEETPPHFFVAVAAREEMLFVSNLSPQTKMLHIINFFEDVGEVFSVRLIVNREGKHVGYGFVEFASAYEAKKALEKKNGEYLHDHRIFLDVAKTAPDSPRPKYSLAEKLWYGDYLLRESLLIEIDETLEGLDETPDLVEAVAVRKKTLFVSDLSCETKISNIINFFKDVGEVVHVRLGVNHEGKHEGYGSVEFASANEAKKAQVKKNGEYLCGNKITLGVAEIAPYPPPPMYCIDHKVWYEDYLRRGSLLIEDEAMEGLDETPDFVEIQEVAARKKTLFIDNLSLKPDICEIISFFQDVGEVFSVRLIVDFGGNHVGCGFIEFASAYVAKKALEKDGKRFQGSYIFLDVAVIAPYPLRPKYNLAEKLWYEDHIRRESLLIEEYNRKKQFCGKKITFSDDN